MRIPIAVIVGTCLGLGLGLMLGIALRGDEPEEAPILSARAHALAEAERENEALRRRIELLEARLESALDAPAIASTRADDATEREGDETPTGDEEEVSAEDVAELEAGGEASNFIDARLLALGFHPSDIERLRRTWEGLELEKLYIQNDRARSGARDGRYRARIMALEREAIAELGEEDYDALLYASGEPNRVRVRRVLPGSAAEAAGLGAGDEIVAYDGEPIFRVGAVRQHTIRCEPGRTVALGVLQDGVEQRVWLPCGPLGVQLEKVSAEPR